MNNDTERTNAETIALMKRIAQNAGPLIRKPILDGTVMVWTHEGMVEVRDGKTTFVSRELP